MTDEKPVVSFANDDVVIPPSGTVDPSKIEDEDAAEEMYSDAFDDFTTASHIYRTSANVRPNKRMLPRRCDMVAKPVDGRIAIGARSDGLPIENSIRACSDRRISGGVSSRIERAKLSADCSFCLQDKRPHVLRRTPQRSTSRYHSSKESEEKDSRNKGARKMFLIGESDDDEIGCSSYTQLTLGPFHALSADVMHPKQRKNNTLPIHRILVNLSLLFVSGNPAICQGNNPFVR